MQPIIEKGWIALLADGTRGTIIQGPCGRDNAWIELEYQRDGCTIRRNALVSEVISTDEPATA